MQNYIVQQLDELWLIGEYETRLICLGFPGLTQKIDTHTTVIASFVRPFRPLIVGETSAQSAS